MNTRRLQISERPKKTKNAFDALLFALHYPALILNSNGKIIQCNEALLEAFNISRVDIINQPLLMICKTYRIKLPFRTIQEALEAGQVKTSIIPKEAPAEAALITQWSISSIERTSHEDILITGFDLTSIIHSSTQEKHIRNSIIDLLPNHYIFWKDKNSTYLGCNSALASAMGLQSKEDIIGKSDYDLPTKKEQSDAYRADDRLVMSTKQSKLNIEEHQTLADGVTRVLSTSKIPLLDKKGKASGVLAIYSDITERKNLEVSLKKAKDEAETANRIKTEFIANMSHDIRTPISGIVGMSKLLEESSLSLEQKQYAQWINESGEQLLSLLNSILDVISTDNVHEHNLHEDEFDLRECLEGLVQLERPSVELKNLSLKVSIDKAIPKTIISDRIKLHRILLNLIGNAVKFTQEGHILIDIKLLSKWNDQIRVRFSVIDSGIGIPKKLQNQIFDRFFRATPSYKGTYTGHGVGLHIAQSFVKLLGGEIKFDSQEGRGSTFYFDLTLKAGHTQALLTSLPLPEPSKAPIDHAHLVSPPHLLLVEDNNIALRMIESLVSKAGCRFTSATDGEQALKLVSNQHFDLIITDIGLPGISGYEFTRAVRSFEASFTRKSVPIIGLTAHTKAKTQEDCMLSGMNEVFTKPIDLTTIKEIMNRFITEDFSAKNTTPTDESLLDRNSSLFYLESYPLLDVKDAMQNLHNKSLLCEMLQMMVDEEIPQALAALQQEYSKYSWESIKKLVHKIKGGAIYCGTLRLKYACQQLEQYQRIGQTALLEKLYQQLTLVIEDTQNHLKQWLQQNI